MGRAIIYSPAEGHACERVLKRSHLYDYLTIYKLHAQILDKLLTIYRLAKTIVIRLEIIAN